MFVAEKRDREEDIIPLMVVRRASPRAERVDMIIASTVLLLLIFGWVVRLAPADSWPRGDFLVASATRHV